MDILYLLVPVSVLLALGVLGVFAWALQGGQFEDVEAEGERILVDEAPQGGAVGAGEAQASADRPEPSR
ncbi:MAG: cbb3-type cytochrome oxidase assembly protein CcoS [Inhella sp.]|jgi:cbb3-type cytochrome oxidase maturation protein|uniref:cbb3-type cytochrome oxidase assembly protein CcoS n=1 Tax=Inhella sp. TaxID=1921806 RepID=UPI0022C3EB86|nr:cbb3-type cytochrome oxidase assembly protein CcoS [Inhella sp.]MCZ8233825.1 cbb3-type cytochrome oxidase assembly protein CcoS [Inhella sp.]